MNKLGIWAVPVLFSILILGVFGTNQNAFAQVFTTVQSMTAGGNDCVGFINAPAGTQQVWIGVPPNTDGTQSIFNLYGVNLIVALGTGADTPCLFSGLPLIDGTFRAIAYSQQGSDVLCDTPLAFATPLVLGNSEPEPIGDTSPPPNACQPEEDDDIHNATLTEVQNIEEKLDGDRPSFITQIVETLTSIVSDISIILGIVQDENSGIGAIKSDTEMIKSDIEMLKDQFLILDKKLDILLEDEYSEDTCEEFKEKAEDLEDKGKEIPIVLEKKLALCEELFP